MAAALNDSLLNGATRFQAWAWGRGRAEGIASGDAVNIVYTYVRGTATATAQSSGIPDRLAFLSSDQIPYARANMAATRYAYMAADSGAYATGLIQPVRTAWFDAPVMDASATTESTPTKERLFTASTAASAAVDLPDKAATRISLMYNKGTPGQARSYVREDEIIRFTVKQRWFKAQGHSKARVRLLPNTALGFSEVDATAHVSMDKDAVWQTHNVWGVGETGSQTWADSSRVRIIRIGLYGEASTVIAPTITKDGVTSSYFFSSVEARSETTAVNKVLRRPYQLELSSGAESVPAASYLQKGFKGQAPAYAVADGRMRFNNWKMANGYSEVRAITEMAKTTVVTPVFPDSTPMTATINLTDRVYTWMGADAVASVESWAGNRIETWMVSAIDARANVTGKGVANNGVRVAGGGEATAEIVGEPIRIVYYFDQGTAANAVVMRLNYNINLDPTGKVTPSRSYKVKPTDRVYVVEGDNRRYSIQ